MSTSSTSTTLCSSAVNLWPTILVHGRLAAYCYNALSVCSTVRHALFHIHRSVLDPRHFTLPLSVSSLNRRAGGNSAFNTNYRVLRFVCVNTQLIDVHRTRPSRNALLFHGWTSPPPVTIPQIVHMTGKIRITAANESFSFRQKDALWRSAGKNGR